MAVVINNPNTAPEEERTSNSFMANLLLLVVFFILLALFVIYILPRLGLGFGGTRISIPDKFNVNIQKSQ